MKRGRDVMAHKKSKQRALDHAANFYWSAPLEDILESANYAERNRLHRFSDRTMKFSKQFHIDADKWFRSCKGVQP